MASLPILATGCFGQRDWNLISRTCAGRVARVGLSAEWREFRTAGENEAAGAAVAAVVAVE